MIGHDYWDSFTQDELFKSALDGLEENRKWRKWRLEWGWAWIDIAHYYWVEKTHYLATYCYGMAVVYHYDGETDNDSCWFDLDDKLHVSYLYRIFDKRRRARLMAEILGSKAEETK